MTDAVSPVATSTTAGDAAVFSEYRQVAIRIKYPGIVIPKYGSRYSGQGCGVPWGDYER
jgi:hypothetical protein